MDKQIFNLEHQYQLYLQRIKCPEEKMHPQQRIQLKQAFFGACGQLLILIRDDVATLDDHQAVEVMKSLEDQVGEFWKKAMEDYINRNKQ